ncbi:MAG: hypothetical protein K2X01_12025 [Cyanobacteria bacterium]|nr:hypothetical protein [Cyanobacteriota bacterium]
MKHSASGQRFLYRLTLRLNGSFLLLLIIILSGMALKPSGFSANAFGLPKFHRHSNNEENPTQSKNQELEHQTNLAPDPESNIPLLGPKTPEPTGTLNSEPVKSSEPMPEKIIETLQSEMPLIEKPLTTKSLDLPSSDKLNEQSETSKTLPLSTDPASSSSTSQVMPSVHVQKKLSPKMTNLESGQVLSSNSEKVTIHIAPLSQEAILMPLNPGWKMTFQGKRENHYLQEFSKSISGQNHENNAEDERVSLQALTGLQSKLTASQWTQAYLLQLARNLANPKNLQANVIRNNPNDALFFWTVKNDKKVEMQSELQRVLLGKEAIYLIRYTRKAVALTPIEKEQWQAYLQVPFLMTMRVLNEKKYSVDAVERYSIYLAKSLKQQALKSQLSKQATKKNITEVKKVEAKQTQLLHSDTSNNTGKRPGIAKSIAKKVDLSPSEVKKIELKKVDKDRLETKKMSQIKLPETKILSPTHPKSNP